MSAKYHSTRAAIHSSSNDGIFGLRVAGPGAEHRRILTIPKHFTGPFTTMKEVRKTVLNCAKLTGVWRQLGHIWRWHPNLERMTCAYAGFVTSRAVNESGKPLLPGVIRDATRAYTSAPGGAAEAEVAYIDVLVNSAPDVFSQAVFAETPEGPVQWDPFQCSLTEFMNTYGEANCQFSYERTTTDNSDELSGLMQRILREGSAGTAFPRCKDKAEG